MNCFMKSMKKKPKIDQLLKILDTKKLYGTKDIETISVDEVYNLI